MSKGTELSGFGGELRRITNRAGFVAIVLLLAIFSEAHAQGLGGLGQLLGGGGSRRQQNSSGQSGSAVTVERNIAPFVGRFTGKQKARSYQGDLNANFACYPAHD